MNNDDYPALFRAADKGAISAQKTYLLLIKIEFIGLIVSAILSSIKMDDVPAWKTFSPTAIAIILFIVFIARLVTLGGFDKKWFSCRAIAESVKSTTWRYMAKAIPYTGEAISKEVDVSFLENLKAIRDKRPEGANKLGRQVISGEDITEQMRKNRGISFDERKELYNKERVIEQRDWYKMKANLNETSRIKWFWSSLVIEGVAVIIAFLLPYNDALMINPVGVLIAIVAVTIAWSETKRHRELAQSYTLVVQELSQLSPMILHVKSGGELSTYVDDAEDVISKEHKMWLAKRDG